MEKRIRLNQRYCNPKNILQFRTKLTNPLVADASLEGLCVVAYFCASGGDEIKGLSFVVVKTRVSPKKQLSISRQELQAAVIATRIKDNILELHQSIVNEVYMWWDSSTVLAWLSSVKKLLVFVANMVAEILDSTSVNSWRHVKRDLNPAELGTSGLTKNQILHSTWLHGPTWIKSEDQWPKKLKIKDIEFEEVVEETCN